MQRVYVDTVAVEFINSEEFKMKKEMFVYTCPNCGNILRTDHPDMYQYCPQCAYPIKEDDKERQEVTVQMPVQMPILNNNEDIVSYCNRRIVALAEHRNELKGLFNSGAISSSSCECGLASDAAVICELRSLVALMGGEQIELELI